jgi:hypothetical protein
VPRDLMPNYQRFLRKNFGARAHELGWIGPPAESDEKRLLRPPLLSAGEILTGEKIVRAFGRVSRQA